jgi:anti-sigma regulatory factor (Ser/Thr protein kinase)
VILGARSTGVVAYASARRCAGVEQDRVHDLAVAASEIATNSLVHGGAARAAGAWLDGEWFVTEIGGAGCIVDPLVGRLRAEGGADGGYGLWLAHQFCDLVQIRSHAAGTVVRLHLRVG